MILNETYSLSNGVQIPKLGLGTWFIPEKEAAEAVRTAVTAGYRLIDTAQAYDNEAGVGEGVRTCGIPREQIFVTSKVAAEAKSYESASASIDETLAKMGLQEREHSGRSLFAHRSWRGAEKPSDRGNGEKIPGFPGGAMCSLHSGAGRCGAA